MVYNNDRSVFTGASLGNENKPSFRSLRLVMETLNCIFYAFFSFPQKAEV